MLFLMIFVRPSEDYRALFNFLTEMISQSKCEGERERERERGRERERERERERDR